MTESKSSGIHCGTYPRLGKIKIVQNLWDYAFIHAPDAIPDWLQHKPEPKPKQPVLPEAYAAEKNLPENVSCFLSNWISDPCYELDDYPRGLKESKVSKKYLPHLTEFRNAWEAYWKEKREWKEKEGENRYFQWKAYYANKFLEIR